MFEKVLVDAADADAPSMTVACLHAVVEECWKVLDAEAAPWNLEGESCKRISRNIHGHHAVYLIATSRREE